MNYLEKVLDGFTWEQRKEILERIRGSNNYDTSDSFNCDLIWAIDRKSDEIIGVVGFVGTKEVVFTNAHREELEKYRIQLRAMMKSYRENHMQEQTSTSLF